MIERSSNALILNKKRKERKDFSCKYTNLKIDLISKWLTGEKTPMHSHPDLTKRMCLKILSEIKGYYGCEKLSSLVDTRKPQYISMSDAIEKDILSIESICWIAQAFGVIDRMQTSAKHVALSVFPVISPHIDKSSRWGLRRYLTSSTPISYALINKARFTILKNNKGIYAQRQYRAVESIANTHLYLHKSNCMNAYKIMSNCVHDAVFVNMGSAQEVRGILKSMFILN